LQQDVARDVGSSGEIELGRSVVEDIRGLDRACIGDRANLDTLGKIEIGARATVAQEVYLSSGTHDFTRSELPLVTAKITIGDDAFLCARTFVLPGITIGARSIVGACSVVTKDVPPDVIAAGNPCRTLRPRMAPTAG